MLTQSIIFTGGETVKFTDLGNFVRILDATADVTLRTYKNGQVKSEAAGIRGGYAEQFTDDFETIEVYSATAQTVKIAIRYGAVVSYDIAPTGNVAIAQPLNAVGSNQVKTVTNASASMLAANAARKYLLIQNKDASGDIYINFGDAATVANGLKIPYGASFELNSTILTGEIFAIGSIASNANIVIIEG